mmetsp:Transcript_9184/g.15266  ORF Transcript_9184/g.15266 Transcript_9184/m.15266 type:complete len:233 (+) Transcript_9184:24-722(+)
MSAPSGSVREVRVKTEDGVELEGVLLIPPESSLPSSREELQEQRRHLGVLLTHPHPKLGGDMHNNVVTALARGLTKQGFTILAINFRGVGNSQGSSSWAGKDERKDVKAALEFLKQQPDIQGVGLVGYSFGSAVGCGVDCDGLKGYVAVSYPYGRVASCALGSHFKLADRNLPKLFLIGKDDQFANVNSLESFVTGMDHPGKVEVFDNVDHFWHGEEKKLLQPVSTFLDSLL